MAAAPQFASLYVGDLQADVTEAMLYEVFNAVGPVGSIRVCRDNVTRKSLGYAYVNFHAVSDAERAIDTLNYSSIKGRSCRIMWCQRDAALRKSGAGNIYVRNLDLNIDNKALYDTFSLFGNILSCKVASNRDGKSYGYGFVHYESEEAAKQAIERVNGMQIGEQTVEVSLHLKASDREGTSATNFTNLYIKSFPQDWDEAKLKEVFGEFGSITSMCVQDNKGRKFAFINYETTESAQKCVEEMNDKDMRTDEEKAKAEEDGDAAPAFEKLYVGRAQTKAERAKEFSQQAGGSDKKSAGDVNLYVKNLADTTEDADLKTLFETFGGLSSYKAVRDEAGKCKGFGFVSFKLADDATKAVTEMHLKVINGKPLYVGLAEKREDRASRLRTGYSGPGKGGPGMKGGKGGGMMPMKGGMGPMGGAMPQMMGGMPQGPKGMMYNPMMGKGAMGGPMMGGKGPMGGPMGMMPRPMMGGQQMMMMGAQQMQMMQMMKGGGMPGGMPGMPGMMGPGMPQMKGMKGAPMPQQMQQQAPMPGGPSGPLDAAALAAAPPAVQKQMIGEKLFPAIQKIHPEMAGKITGMMLEMDASELLMLLESEQQMRAKVNEALHVLGGK